MNFLRPPHILGAVFFLLSAAPAMSDPEALEKHSGKFLYAGDDDWDWASPLGAEELSGLSKYGVMPWSALDWAEEGLREVRGALVGTPPNVGKYLDMAELEKLRGPNVHYEHREQSDENMLELLSADPPPNVIILMQDTGKGGIFGEKAVDALAAFVKGGGRLVVLDDWAHHVPLYEKLVGSALALPKPPAPPLDAEEAGGAEKGIVGEELVRRITELLADLGAADFAKREAAMAALRELGLPAVELAEELGGDDPEIAARLSRLKARLDPVPQRSENQQPNKKHEEAARRVKDSAAKLEEAGIPHEVSEVYVNKGGLPLPALRIQFPVR